MNLKVSCYVDRVKECALKGMTLFRAGRVTLLYQYTKKREALLFLIIIYYVYLNLMFSREYMLRLFYYLNLERFLRADYQVAKIDVKSDDEISLDRNSPSALTNINIDKFSK